MSIDRMDWHYGAKDFPKDLNPECGGTHIGFYLTWIIDNDLVGEFLLEDAEEELKMVKKRKMTGRDFLVKMCDEKFFKDDLNQEANEFTSDYYEKNKYFDDLDSVFEGYNYGVENTWENYEKIGKVISKRYEEWKKLKL